MIALVKVNVFSPPLILFIYFYLGPHLYKHFFLSDQTTRLIFCECNLTVSAVMQPPEAATAMF